MLNALRAAAIAIFAALSLIGPAQAQSGCAIFTFGNVPTPGQWNSCVSSKQDVLGYTAVNKAGDAMAGRLATIGSTTTRSGFAILPGVAPTTPVDGDIWVTTAGVFARISGVTVGPFSATGSAVPAVVQGDTLYGSAPGTLSVLPKNTSATRYLSNTGTNNNPAWAQVDLTNGVTNVLPFANMPTGTVDRVLGYFTSTTQQSTALTNCATALTYSTSTHSFGCNGSTGSGTVTSVGLLNGYGLSISGSPITTSGNITAGVSLLSVQNILGANVAMNVVSTYFDGPSATNGTTGTYFASGSVVVTDTAAANIFCKLYDGTTVMASGVVSIISPSERTSLSLSGVITNPAGNIRIACANFTANTGSMLYNISTLTKDSMVTAIRIAQ